MPKFIINKLDGGLNKYKNPHEIANNELSVADNIVYRGEWVNRPDHDTDVDAVSGSHAIGSIADYIIADGSSGVLLGHVDGIAYLNGTTLTTRFNGTTRTIDDRWKFCEADGIVYATNGVDKPKSSSDPANNNFTNVSWETSGDAHDINSAKVILPWNRRLLLFNTDDDTVGEVPFGFQWTEIDNHDRVLDTNNNHLDMTNTPIIAAKKLGRGVVAAYKTDMVTAIQDTGAPLYFIPRFSEQVGLIGSEAVCEIPGGNFYVGTTGFYTISPGGASEVGQKKVRDYFFEQLDRTYQNNVYCYTRWAENEIVIGYPNSSATNGEPNKCLVYNWSDGVWSEWDFVAYCGFQRYRTGTSPVDYLGASAGVTKRLITGTGADVSSKLHTKAFINLPSPQNPEAEDTIEVTKVKTDATPATATVKCGEGDMGSDTPSFESGTITVDAGRAPFVDIDKVSGRYITFGAENFNRISEFYAHFRTAGDN